MLGCSHRACPAPSRRIVTACDQARSSVRTMKSSDVSFFVGVLLCVSVQISVFNIHSFVLYSMYKAFLQQFIYNIVKIDSNIYSAQRSLRWGDKKNQAEQLENSMLLNFSMCNTFFNINYISCEYAVFFAFFLSNARFPINTLTSCTQLFHLAEHD
jgi:hypothetical protein